MLAKTAEQSSSTIDDSLDQQITRGSFEFNGWRIETQQAPISTSNTIEEFEASSSIHVPEMTFFENFYSITHIASNNALCFNTRGALYGSILFQNSSLPLSFQAFSSQPAYPYISSLESDYEMFKSDRTEESCITPSRRLLHPVKVSDASLWQTSSHMTAQHAFDWTYSTQYRGHIVRVKELPLKSTFLCAYSIRYIHIILHFS